MAGTITGGAFDRICLIYRSKHPPCFRENEATFFCGGGMPKGDARLRTGDGHLNQIAGRLKERRRVLRLTQEGLCARLAYVTEGAWLADRQEIVRIESGGRIVSTVELPALALALEVDPCWLLLGELKANAHAAPAPPNSS